MLSELRALANMLLPQRCLGCREALTDDEAALPYPLCALCQRSLTPIGAACCAYCGTPLISEMEVCLKCRERRDGAHGNGDHGDGERKDKERSLSYNRSLYVYMGLAQRLIWSYKFSHHKRLARFFAEGMCLLLHNCMADFTAESVIVPIPGSPRNIRRRGWDQTRVIAHYLHTRYRIPVLHLLRHGGATSQKSLGAQARATNARATFTLRPRVAIPPNLHAVILLDDVYTTGATVEACASLLRKAGVPRVCSATLSITL